MNADEEKMFTYNINGLKPCLWTPQHPNLYDFRFPFGCCKKVTNGLPDGDFRFHALFEVKEGLFFLNGNRYWLRGGNHIPFALAPNDLNLANTFMQLMKAGNIDRHSVPILLRGINSGWEQLIRIIGVSFEGTWPWLMIHSTPLPDAKLIEMWKRRIS